MNGTPAHCSICALPGLFLVRRGRQQEALCESHFDWLIENSSRTPEFSRIPGAEAALPPSDEGDWIAPAAKTPAQEKNAAACRRWYAANRERVAAYKKQHYQAKRGSGAAAPHGAASRERRAAYSKAYYQANRERLNAYNRRRYDARKRAS